MRERGRALENIMKKKIMSVMLCLALLITIAPKPKAHADALTAAMIGQLAFGMASSWGINFTAGSATGQGMSNFMAGQVESYVNEHGGSLGSLFVGEAAVNVAGKLVVGQQLFEGIRNFIGWLGNKYDLGEVATALSMGVFDNAYLPSNWDYVDQKTNVGLEIVAADRNEKGPNYIQVYNNGTLKGGLSLNNPNSQYFGTANVTVSEGYIIVQAPYYSFDGKYLGTRKSRIQNAENLQEHLQFSVPENWGMPQPLPQNKEWQGDFSDTPGLAEPPTDLPDFLSRIPVGIAENNLAVTGEIVEADTGGDMPIPSPSPSPSPSYNKSNIALIIAEILALINSLSGDTAVDQEAVEQVAQEVAEQAQTLPDTITQTATQTQEAIQDATQTMTDTLTQTQTQTQEAIQDATQTITDSQTEIKDAIQEQTQEITDIKDAIQDATDVPTRDKWEQVKKDLHGVFPFCIPWDIYGMLTAFSAEPRAPHFEYPFQIPSIGLDYTLELDFADFDPVAQILRTLELIAFSIGLAILTSKVIRW